MSTCSSRLLNEPLVKTKNYNPSASNHCEIVSKNPIIIYVNMKVLYFRTFLLGRVVLLTGVEVKYWMVRDYWFNRVMHVRLSASVIMQVLIQKKYEVDFLEASQVCKGE